MSLVNLKGSVLDYSGKNNTTKLNFANTTFDVSKGLGSTIYNSLKSNFSSGSLSEEEVKKLENTSHTNSQVNNAQSHLQTIYFKDPLTGAAVKSALSEESLNTLRENFGNENVSKIGQAYILSGEAESFVSGWYGDIAYTRGYLSADADKNGFLEQSELDETRSGYGHKSLAMLVGTEILSVSVESIVSYSKLSRLKEKNKTLYENGKFAASTIALELDKTIKNDKNLDGKIVYEEAFSEEEIITALEDNLQYAYDNREKVEAQLNFDYLNYVLESAKAVIDDKLESIKDKLRNNEDFNTLSKEEQKLLKEFLPQAFDENAQFDKTSFDKLMQKEEQEFIEKSLKYLGLDENSDQTQLDYAKLKAVMKELRTTFLQAYSANEAGKINGILNTWA
ncbi:hypothetical protein DMB95_04690 [Campylobacter sp. MIT 12-8780]|uniref:hypothetical protein n=1 Tax=unclassified Campylobacter TaxID=2593542 RepID=UPI00115F1B50|nr:MULTISPECIES: hypothetical protein [unclassified Campylobacter]NDJ27053.1 hypothetical protein [Campylobacter sp. MIT 19-121]TQR41646.1 hypothetical protein DMB95_04690 [Campylobacter sp. MIT 12-8780]